MPGRGDALTADARGDLTDDETPARSVAPATGGVGRDHTHGALAELITGAKTGRRAMMRRMAVKRWVH